MRGAGADLGLSPPTIPPPPTPFLKQIPVGGEPQSGPCLGGCRERDWEKDRLRRNQEPDSCHQDPHPELVVLGRPLKV